MKRLTENALFRLAVVLIASAMLLAMFALSRAAAAQDVPHLHANASGACALSGTLGTGETRAVYCDLGHAESVLLTAAVETGSLAVQGHVVRANGGTVLVALTNFSGAPASLDFGRIRLFRAAPATPPAPVDPLHEGCIFNALAAGLDASGCHQVPNYPVPASAVAAADAG